MSGEEDPSDYTLPKYTFRVNESQRSWADRYIVERVWLNGDTEYLCACPTANDAITITDALKEKK